MVLTLAIVAPTPRGALAEDQAKDVRVVNFPATQVVKGAVVVPEPIPAAVLQSFTTATVPPVEPTDPVHMVNLGVLKSSGYTEAVLSLRGTLKGDVTKIGAVGVLLLPDEASVVAVFEEDAIAQFDLRAEVENVGRGGRHFASTPARALIAFPNYRVYAYNTTDKTVAIELYAYLRQ